MKFVLTCMLAGVILGIAGALLVGNLVRSHHAYSCPPGQHLTYMTPGESGYQPGLQECVK